MLHPFAHQVPAQDLAAAYSCMELLSATHGPTSTASVYLQALWHSEIELALTRASRERCFDT
jgi:hypothetical protein